MADEIFKSIKSKANPDWAKHLDSAADIFHQLDSLSGVPVTDPGFHTSFDHYYDNLSARQCHGKPLPCKAVNGTNDTECITTRLAETVYRLGHWEYSYIYRDHPSSLAASTASLGVWIGQLVGHIRDVMAGTTKFVYFHNIAHDGSVSRLLSILQVDSMVWPGMGAEVVFELYRKKARSRLGREVTVGPRFPESKFYIRVLFGGKVLKSSHPTLGLIDMIPVQILLDYLESLIGKEPSFIRKICQRG